MVSTAASAAGAGKGAPPPRRATTRTTPSNGSKRGRGRKAARRTDGGAGGGSSDVPRAADLLPGSAGFLAMTGSLPMAADSLRNALGGAKAKPGVGTLRGCALGVVGALLMLAGACACIVARSAPY